MSVITIPARNSRFNLGWILMLISSGLMALSYLIMMFEENAHTLFMIYSAFSLYAFLVLLNPFREGKKWAWMATWILPVVLALTAYFAPEFAPYYFGAAVVFVLGLLLTIPEFFSNRMNK